ncbi:DUF2236 domain-containing protein [Nonomuraea sp. MG754425]|uniref:oxygenase MpaB family protein n=1 Tax=Nonomuraea sp. MG754425 TaxID=2570319 RepID=UPI001F25B8E4|nr:oxygenase MpaB family protein [Nonomuraea sp. MG754425]MCF6471203.1 DUF2236 domain-containing protein [Nonomuraea sp. MG754425]
MKPIVTPGGGLFGPTSITWRVHTETPAWPAAVRAFQLQALHPRTIRGIAQNCLLDDPGVAHARLRRQLGYVAVRTFGSREQAEQVAGRARQVHARLVGLDPDTGVLFRVDDEENLRWVHCVEVASHLEVAGRCGVPLTAAERDAYVAEQRRGARLVGLGDVPGDAGELDAYLTGMRPRLAATAQARAALRACLSPALPLRTLFAAAPLALGSLPAAGALAFATLPAWARQLYGRHGDEAAGHAADLALRALRAAITATPDRLVSPEIRAARGLMRAVTEVPGADVAA